MWLALDRKFQLEVELYITKKPKQMRIKSPFERVACTESSDLES